MTITARQPSLPAARATPWAWLPAEAATTPRARASGASLAIMVYKIFRGFIVNYWLAYFF